MELFKKYTKNFSCCGCFCHQHIQLLWDPKGSDAFPVVPLGQALFSPRKHEMSWQECHNLQTRKGMVYLLCSKVAQIQRYIYIEFQMDNSYIFFYNLFWNKQILPNKYNQHVGHSGGKKISKLRSESLESRQWSVLRSKPPETSAVSSDAKRKQVR